MMDFLSGMSEVKDNSLAHTDSVDACPVKRNSLCFDLQLLYNERSIPNLYEPYGLS